MAVLRHAPDPTHIAMWRETQIAGQRLGVELQSIEMRDPSELEAAFSLIIKNHARALMILPGALFFVESKRIARLTTKHRLPAITLFTEFARNGGLMAYGPNLLGVIRHEGIIAAKVLLGANPAVTQKPWKDNETFGEWRDAKAVCHHMSRNGPTFFLACV